MSAEVTHLKRQQIVDALRRGTVPRRGLELFAVGMDRFDKALDKELTSVAAGEGAFKAVRGDYGTQRQLDHISLDQLSRRHRLPHIVAAHRGV